MKAALLLILVSSVAHAQEAPQPEPPPPSPPPALDQAAVEQIVAARLAALPKPPPTAGYKDGFYIQAEAGDSKLVIGGFLQMDARHFVADETDPKVDQFAFRSIRPDLRGTVLKHYDFRLFPDFAGGKLVVQDAFVDIHYRDDIEVRVGKFKVPFGLERLQVETATTFVERGLPTQLAPNRDLGAMIFGELGIVSYQLGIFNGVADGQSGDGDVSDDKEVAARVFVRPADGLGLGAAATYGDKAGTVMQPDTPIFKTQGQTTFFQYADGVIADGRHWRATAQGHYYRGPVGVLAEFIRSAQHVARDGTHERVVVDSWQVLGQWVLTGERATYRSLIPTHDYGAVDLAARVGELRVVDGEIFDVGFADPTRAARRAWSAGAGSDWYLSRAVRLMLDVEHTWFTLGGKMGDRPAETSIIGRVQTVF